MAIRIFVAGHSGMVGSAIASKLSDNPDIKLILASKSELDLTDSKAVEMFIKDKKPDQIYVAAAMVGGIHANNSYPADFITNNLLIQTNIIKSAFKARVNSLLFLGSSCIYPQLAPQPLKEEYLLTGLLEPTNEPYAIAKIAGIKMCESFNRQHGTDYRCVMPTNLYGKNDNFHEKDSHVIPAMMRRFHEAKKNNAKKVIVWGSGNPKREFLHVDDLASACIYLMKIPHNEFISTIPNKMCSHVNVGTGRDIKISDLAKLMSKVTGFKGEIEFDTSKPDGTPQKLLDVNALNSLGWKYSIELENGLDMTYKWFLSNFDNLRK